MIAKIHGSRFNIYFGKKEDEDVKPTNDVPNASFYYEIDTTKVFTFDGDSKEWLFQFELSF